MGLINTCHLRNHSHLKFKRILIKWILKPLGKVSVLSISVSDDRQYNLS